MNLLRTLKSLPARRRLLLYAIPIILGLGGLVFAQQIEQLWLRMLIVILSVALPLFAGGNVLARYKASQLEKAFLFVGVLMLVLGAALSVSGFYVSLERASEVPKVIADASRFIGFFSLILGLVVMLFTVIRAGEDIEEIRERFRYLADHINEGFILMNADDNIVLVNNQFLEMFDLKREELLGKKAMDMALEKHAGDIHQELLKRYKGVSSEYEISRNVRGDTRRFWFNGTPIFDARGRLTATIATVRDTTEQHRLAERVEQYASQLEEQVQEKTRLLQRSEEQLKQLLMTLNEGFLTIDASNAIHFANQHIAALLGVQKADLLHRDIFDFVDTSGRVRLMNLLALGPSLSGPESRQEINFLNAQAKAVPTMVAIAYVESIHEESPIYSCVVTSLDEQKKLQRQLENRAEELERVNEELRQHDRAKDSFLSNVSHELRTPLSTIQGYVEMLESGNLGEMEGPQKSALRVMDRNINRLLGLINEIIEFSRMEIRGIQLELTLFSMGRLIRESVSFIHPNTLAKDISVNLFLPENLPYLWGDRNRLAQVLGILLNNAVKFTDRGGLIQISATVRDQDTLAITVTDSGIGFDATYKDRIFNKFFQVDSSKTRRYEGAGIGLSIARSIVEAHGGGFEVESEPGQGSSFTFILPEALFLTEASVSAFLEAPPLKLLTVDNDRPLFSVLESLFEATPVGLVLAQNGFEALRSAQTQQPDCIIIHDSVTDLAGLATLGQLQQDPELCATPVLVISNEEPDLDLEYSGMGGGIHYLPRPFPLAHLLQEVEKLLFKDTLEASSLSSESALPEARTWVLLVDADPGFLEWLELGLHRNGIACICATSPQKALSIAERQHISAIFLDADLPEEEALHSFALFHDHEATREAPLFAMTGLPDAMAFGHYVQGILYKPFKLEKVLEALVPYSDAS